MLSSLTTMLGRHAAPVAERLVAALAKRSSGKNETFGATMRDLRRELLVDGFPLALALVAYGDADWILGSNPQT